METGKFVFYTIVLQSYEGLCARRLELETLMDASEPDRTAIMARIDEVGRLQVMMRKQAIGLLLDVSSLLTVEQRAGFKKLMNRRKGPRRGRGAPGRRRGPPPGP